jgi:outer membrane protein assembly factor BamB
VPGGIPFHIVPKSAPLPVGSVILRGCDVAKMQAFDAETGLVMWEYQVTGAALAPYRSVIDKGRAES